MKVSYCITKTLPLFLLLLITLSSCIFTPKNKSDGDLIYTYPNIGDSFTVINSKTHEVEKTVKMNLNDSVHLFGWCLSADEKHLIFAGFNTNESEDSIYIVNYNIIKDTIESIFNTGIQELAVPRLGTAYLENCDSKFYLYTHKAGLYVIDYYTEEVSLISSEIIVGKYFYTFEDSPWTIIKKYIAGAGNISHTELEFYLNDSMLSDTAFVLNKNGIDGIDVMDLTYSSEQNKIFFTYLLSNGRSRGVSALFGSYDLETLEFLKGEFTLPWGENLMVMNGYSISYSESHNECYVVGEQDKVFVIDVSNENYSIKELIELPGKTKGPTKSIILSDENIAYFGCTRDDLVYVCDLNKKEIINSFYVERPFLFILVNGE